jgi:hypothetical protein
VVIRITQDLTGSIDGIHVRRLSRDEVYDVGASLARFLVASGLAAPVSDETPALLIRRDMADPGDSTPSCE